MLFETFYPDAWMDSTTRLILMNCIRKDTGG